MQLIIDDFNKSVGKEKHIYVQFLAVRIEEKREIDQRLIAAAVIDRERLEINPRRSEGPVNHLICAKPAGTSALSCCAVCYEHDDQKNPA